MNTPRAGAILLLVAWLPLGYLGADVSVDLQGPATNTLILGVIEDPDPFGSVAWQPFRSIPPERILNPGGFARGDGRPDVSVIEDPDPISLRPVVVWAYNAGTDHDIAIAEWAGSSWSPIEFLTSGTDDDLDPRIAVDPDGTKHVVWWIDGALDRVFLATKPAAAPVWEAPVEVTSSGRRPSVAVFDGVLRVSYERDSAVPGMAQDIVVVRREAGGSFTEEYTTPTARTERLDAVLHSSGTKLWLDWKHGNLVFGCVEYGPGGWGAVEEPLWSDPSWIGVEDTRKVIQNQVRN